MVEIISKNEICVKITDFGMAQYLDLDDDKMRVQAGSSSYMAPEALSWGPLTEKSDIWSAGVVIYVLMQGKFPFDGESFKQIYKSIKKKDLKEEWQSEKWSHVSEDCRNFLNLCFVRDPKLRPSCSDLLNHPWFNKAVESTREPESETEKAGVKGLILKLKSGRDIPEDQLLALQEAIMKLDLNIKDLFNGTKKSDLKGIQDQLKGFFQMLSEEEIKYIIKSLDYNKNASASS